MTQERNLGLSFYDQYLRCNMQPTSSELVGAHLSSLNIDPSQYRSLVGNLDNTSSSRHFLRELYPGPILTSPKPRVIHFAGIVGEMRAQMIKDGGDVLREDLNYSSLSEFSFTPKLTTSRENYLLQERRGEVVLGYLGELNAHFGENSRYPSLGNVCVDVYEELF